MKDADIDGPLALGLSLLEARLGPLWHIEGTPEVVEGARTEYELLRAAARDVLELLPAGILLDPRIAWIGRATTILYAGFKIVLSRVQIQAQINAMREQGHNAVWVPGHGIVIVQQPQTAQGQAAEGNEPQQPTSAGVPRQNQPPDAWSAGFAPGGVPVPPIPGSDEWRGGPITTNGSAADTHSHGPTGGPAGQSWFG